MALRASSNIQEVSVLKACAVIAIRWSCRARCQTLLVCDWSAIACTVPTTHFLNKDKATFQFYHMISMSCILKTRKHIKNFFFSKYGIFYTVWIAVQSWTNGERKNLLFLLVNIPVSGFGLTKFQNFKKHMRNRKKTSFKRKYNGTLYFDILLSEVGLTVAKLQTT